MVDYWWVSEPIAYNRVQYLEDHPMTCKWLIGPWWSLLSPKWGCGTPSKRGVILSTYDTWDDPPSTLSENRQNDTQKFSF